MVTVPPRAAAPDTLINMGVTVTMREPCWAGAHEARTPVNSKEVTKKRSIAKASVPAV
ncbi:hypothetical protein GCM10008961_15660 [Deinococcus knuensis]|uniref:Uncharacterized protein n=1 Tax=Deinococcus knuensis TaxID=1837380 RepID=A0ABQ2SI85_9DEIO|nr:hypothetical protein GCM10008961_15660 [Deinococcus knuensis]